MFLDRPGAMAREAVHITLATEKVRPGYTNPAPHVLESEQTDKFRLLTPDALFRMKLTVARHKERMHLRDRVDGGLVDETWLERVEPPLRGRLQVLLDNPER